MKKIISNKEKNLISKLKSQYDIVGTLHHDMVKVIKGGSMDSLIKKANSSFRWYMIGQPHSHALNCMETDKQVLMFAYVPIKIQESQYSAVLRLINKIQMDNFDSVSLFINENCNQLMSQSALNVRVDFRIDEEVFRFAFYPLVSTLDDYFIEFIRIISAGDEEQVPDLDLSELLSLSEQNDPEAQYRLAIKYYKGEGGEQDLGKAIELFGASLSNGRNETAHTLKECIDDLSCRIKEFSETQDYEKASSLQALIDKSENLLNLYGKEWIDA